MAFLFLLASFTIPVAAWSDSESYEHSNSDIVYGFWTSGDKAIEEYDDVYKMEIIFKYTGVDVTADVYKIRIDFDGVTPGWPWAESCSASYRWGTSGDWNHIAYFDIVPSDCYWNIDDATSSTLQLKLMDENRWPYDLGHTWDFGFVPILWAYWY